METTVWPSMNGSDQKTSEKYETPPGFRDMGDFINNAMISRMEAIWTSTQNEKRDINFECGYPASLKVEDYKKMYEREIGNRVVNIYPDECWALDPEVYETEGQVNTEFEKAWEALNKQAHIYHYLHRVDRLSGIGRYGGLYLAIDDGEEPDQPVDGLEFDAFGQPVKDLDFKLLYLRAFDESTLRIVSLEKDKSNPRYGLPSMYQVQMEEVELVSEDDTNDATTVISNVHWHRIIHVADNRDSSEVLGIPRMRPVFNRVKDLQKLLGGSAEMFWKGAYPGYSFEVAPELASVGVQWNSTTLREEMDKYMNGLQRYIALKGLKTKSLAPQVADPRFHVESQLNAIAIIIGCPLRIFVGSEEAKLASTQDARAWIKRLNRRQTNYLTPLLVQPTVDRLMALGCLPRPKHYQIAWPDLNSPTQDDKASKAVKLVVALEKYVKAGGRQYIPPMEFLTMIMGFTLPEAKNIMKAAAKEEKKMAAKAAEMAKMGLDPAGTPVGSVGAQPTAGAVTGIGKSQIGE